MADGQVDRLGLSVSPLKLWWTKCKIQETLQNRKKHQILSVEIQKKGENYTVSTYSDNIGQQYQAAAFQKPCESDEVLPNFGDLNNDLSYLNRVLYGT